MTGKLRLHPGWTVSFLLSGTVFGLIVGAGLGPLSRWVLEQLPFSMFALRLGALADEPDGLVLFAVLGAAVGMSIADTARKETLSIAFDPAVTGQGVILTRDRVPHCVVRHDVAAVFRDGKDLVLTGHDGTELARGDVELLEGSRVADAFRTRGWPWREVAASPQRSS